MLKRRLFLQLTASLPALLLSAGSRAETEFERYQREQRAGVQNIKNAWQDYRSNYLAAYRDYRQQLEKVWSKPELSDKKVWVEYSDNLRTRRTVDFERNEVRLSFTGEEAARLSDARIRAEFEKVINASLEQAYKADPVLARTGGAQPPASRQPVAGIKPEQITELLQQARQQQQRTGKGEVVTITIPLNRNAVPQRAQNFLPIVKQQAQKWRVDPALVMAIIQNESSFNPMARSHIPAFGLMQIVPASAGRDATRKAWGKEKLLTGAELFRPETNIELGCAYLNILDTQYLAAVKDPQSRLYCVIAAYNTGAGNVARSFTGNTSVRDAAPRINALSPTQVYAHLRRRLPYEETRNYLEKVNKSLTTYKA
ncbi:DUF3393 domain-containing protein [Oceanospirillaceae bacterium ASx5O]|nr:DUF3393 domain-containing protein [Oceanospirillaceae bacterium ASx5O]